MFLDLFNRKITTKCDFCEFNKSPYGSKRQMCMSCYQYGNFRKKEVMSLKEKWYWSKNQRMEEKK